MVASKLDFRGKAKFWVNWAVRNQQNPEMYPLIPNQDIEESQLHEDTYRGLHEVIPHKVETRIPRLPWGSQKALIINLESSIELSRAQEESNTIQQLMESRGIDTTVVCAREDDDPKNLRSILASNHWDIIHFCGHMGVEDGQYIGHSGGLTATEFVASCCRAGPPRLVILNACKSGDTSIETDIAGISGPIAEQFCIRGVDAVVATRWEIWDVAARDFSIGFWTHVTQAIPQISIEKAFSIDVRSAILFARKGLKSLHPNRDACWLAYALFESRKDGCIIPSQNIVIPGVMPGEYHPPFIDIHNHTMICEHLSPGSAGLYIMSAPACTGKTSISKLALQTLGFDNEMIDECYQSTRHDHLLKTIEVIKNQLKRIDEAPLLPLIIDDAEILINHVGSGIFQSLLQISRVVPLLIITRERTEHQGLYMFPFEKFGLNPDELIHLKPHIMTPVGLAAYMEAHFRVQLNTKEALNLSVRMNSTFFAMPKFVQSYAESKTNLDLLECPRNAPLLNRLSTISDEEILAIQMISELATPIACKLRCMVAWDKLAKEGVVQTQSGVFETLCSLDILQDWFDADESPSDDELHEVLEKIPAFLRDITIPDEDMQPLIDLDDPNNPALPKHPIFTKLFTAFTINTYVAEKVKRWKKHKDLALAMRFAMNALLAIDPTGQMPYLSDGYDNPEMEIRINQPIENEKRKFTGQHLLSILRAGTNQRTNVLDKELKIWFENPEKMMDSIEEIPDSILFELRCRVPSLSILTCKLLGEFIIAHMDKFQTSNPAKAALMYQLWLKGSYLSLDEFWKTEKWNQLKEESKNTFLKNEPESETIWRMKEINNQAHHLLMFKSHAERELNLLVASKEALSIESESRHELMLLHYDFGQILLRHILFSSKDYTYHAFCCHVEKLGEQLSRPPSGTFYDSGRLPDFERFFQFFRLSQLLIQQRVGLEQDSDARSELSWIRDLMETALQMGQMKKNPDLRKALMSEAASRSIALHRRNDISWTDLDLRIRARQLRELRDRAWKDIEALPKWITEELAPHLVRSFDSSFPLPPFMREKIPRELWGQMPAENWIQVIDSTFEKSVGTTYQKTLDLTHILRHDSATDQEMDHYLGAQSALCVSRVAALMWRGTRDMDCLAKPFGQIAATYPELLSEQERKDAERFRPPPSHS
jgi:hypothetical protein